MQAQPTLFSYCFFFLLPFPLQSRALAVPFVLLLYYSLPCCCMNVVVMVVTAVMLVVAGELAMANFIVDA